MPFFGRAEFNLLMQKSQFNPALPVEEWQVRDYRDLTLKDLWNGLKELGVSLNEAKFKQVCEEAESPEDLALMFDSGESPKKIYPFIFELWRRLYPSRETLSIFCDELDTLIRLHEEGEVDVEEKLLSRIFELSDLLDGHVDSGYHPKTIFKKISYYFGSDIEAFLYKYINDQIEKGNETLASELLDNFFEYMEKRRWFDLLRIKLLSGALTEDATAMMARFLESLKEHKEIGLYLELLRYLIKSGHRELFLNTYNEALLLIKTGEEYLEMLRILTYFYHLNDLKAEESQIRQLIASKGEEKKVSQEEKDYLLKFTRQ